jgi:uncharacterized protein
MKLLFSEISRKTHRYFITDNKWFPNTELRSAVAATATISVFRQDNETVVFQGKIEGKCKVMCDRCGEPYEENLASEFEYLVTTREEISLGLVDQECRDEDACTFYLTEPIIEVDEILREQVLLAVPMKNLCSENCKGICIGCGVVLSKALCRCNQNKKDSPFAVLRKLKDQ